MIRGRLVTFMKCHASARLSAITHVVLEGASETLCGRTKWTGDEGPVGYEDADTEGEPCCRRCSKKLAALVG